MGPDDHRLHVSNFGIDKTLPTLHERHIQGFGWAGRLRRERLRKDASKARAPNEPDLFKSGDSRPLRHPQGYLSASLTPEAFERAAKSMAFAFRTGSL